MDRESGYFQNTGFFLTYDLNIILWFCMIAGNVFVSKNILRLMIIQTSVLN